MKLTEQISIPHHSDIIITTTFTI